MPSCAQTCFNGAVDLSGCAADDNLCQCGPASETTNVQNFLTTCLAQSCTSTEISDYQTWAISTCLDVALSVLSASVSSMTAFYPATATAGAGLTTSRRTNPTTTVTTRPSAAASSSTPKPKRVSIGLIIGVVIGAIFVLGFISMAVIFCLWRHSKSKAKKRVLKPQQSQQNHQVQPLMAPSQTQLQPQFAQYQVPQSTEQKTPVQIIAQPVHIPQSPPQVPIVPHNKFETPPNNTVEMEGEGRKSFVEIGGTETVIRGDAQRPAELGSDWSRGGQNHHP
ncbi:hypothetical protein GLAREA_09763 [Glarea lozoyensis ATCC 20868]|uniref:CFEM domain-containing protein n=1 Tax=Glarea lozoyensis (strain ATCC 20868 / MF5171) TaxID=1116229 RepID=S3CQ85_GLAL2|nr:uncharacterized protein GLAREA_09763 [Glarea lozoyensis ATCC 20868]EPE28642.1 hypothetical protein GLAREA_09763 [Glarea lozoyensis ATCC 20868]